MGIKFHVDGEKEPPVIFDDVKMDQFFINRNGSLCHKVSKGRYNMIALADGTPCALSDKELLSEEPIGRLLPHVKKITWE
jgi:hypothetical protein